MRTEIQQEPITAQRSPDAASEEKYLDEKADSKAEPQALAYEQAEGQWDESKERFTAQDLIDGNPFPEDTLPEETGPALTVRAVLVGTALGLVIGASNVYLGLKTGITFGGGLFGGILGFAVLKFMSRTFPAAFGGGSFGPRENVTVQSAATASSGLASMFVAAVPAMYRLGLLTTPRQDFGRLVTFSLVSAFYGCFFAIPLRKFYILKQKLIFPSPTATAIVIRSLHSTGGAAIAMKKVWVLVYSFVASIAWVVVNQYVPGILLDQHVFYWFYTWGWRTALAVDNWNWYTEITPAYTGAGMLAGMNASWSMLGGAFLAWGIIGPSLIATGQATGRQLEPMDPQSRWSYTSMNYKPLTQDIHEASPRYWLLWPGVFIMLLCSVTEVACNAPTIYRGFRGAFLSAKDMVQRKPVREFPGEIPDPAPKEQQVQWYYWVGGLVLSVIFTVVVCAVQFDMSVGLTILAILLAFIFSFIGIQCSGTTDTNPLTAVAKVSQLILGGVTKAEGRPINQARLENLIGGSIASSAAAHAVDMVGDLKTGHWVRASPRSQFWAQLAGSVFAIPFSAGLFVLFSSAYPCINDASIEECPFSVPSVAAWQAVAVAVTAPKLPVSLSSGLTAIFLGGFFSLLIVARYFWIPTKYHNYLPNGNAVGLSFVLPQIYVPIAMAFGATLAHFWNKKYTRSSELYMYSVAAGMVAGEGIGGVINAALTIGGVDGGVYGTTVGLPPW
ncbi:OPT superfamily oligopeptide transporter [Tilletiopsis washingtonensis]|jgi:OPT family oligopeptide transporter|uniref:OPT superfamily oligopeptide transporter n=1 Tax=Tilletiopsis washingtonensis TaxID=58919 RepID=A0A316Z405_9BASI|nr:OPT superfamily oligopeptide transporter [Tilletiopsis washingtonensis]PWN96106.1 OPT superfamily oligopeptide transporter [Tilletiopsis washingtonensis]